jgi:anti-sigma-K factor RskA
MDNIEARKIAERALQKLLEFRASPSPSIKDLADVADEVRIPPDSERSAANQCRVEVWLAIRKIIRTLDGNNPTTSNLTAFWRQAIDLTKLWLEAIDRYGHGDGGAA